MASSTQVDLTAGEQVQGILPVLNGGTGASTLAGAGLELTINKNAANGYCGLNSSGYVAPGQLGSGSASASTLLAGNNSWVAPSAAPAASTIPLWDANQNFSANAFIEGLTPITTAGGTTTLTIVSDAIQYFTGISNQTLVLPTTSVVTGVKYRIINNSSGVITVNASAGATVVAMAANTDCAFTALVATPTTPAGWEAQYGGTTVTDSAASITLAGGNQCYVFTGSSPVTWTLPSVTGNTGSVLTVENRGSAAITVNAAGADHIWFQSSLTTMTVAAGASLPLINDGTYWNSLSLDLVNNAVGILGVANGGTGVSSIATLIANNLLVQTTATQTLTNKTYTGYTETVQAVGTVTTSKTLPSLAGGTLMTMTLTAADTCVTTMPTATSGQSFVLQVKQAATPTGNATFTSVHWIGGTAPTITTTANALDFLTFFCFGGVWYGTYAQGFS